MPRTRCAPLPLVGRGWGWGWGVSGDLAHHRITPTRLASLATLPTRGRVETEFDARLGPSCLIPSSAQSERAGILGITQATAAVAPKAELPFEANVQFARKEHEGVDQIGSQHPDAFALIAVQAETMGELQRQEQRGSACARRAHMHGAALEYHLRALHRDQLLRCCGGSHRSLLL